MRKFAQLVLATVVLWAVTLMAVAQIVTYHRESTRPLSRFTSDQLELLLKVNHADSAHLTRFQSILVPDVWIPDELPYSPMPQEIAQLSRETKAIVVDLAAQTFGAYECGKLVRWGPVSSGDRRHQTPSGTYHLNWHSRLHASTENPEWIMPWYFNFANGLGLGLHEYVMPGRPASHGCVRMLEIDAKWLFRWGDGWTLTEYGHRVEQPGTLVLIVGKYDFGSPPPWLRPDWWEQEIALPLQQTASK